MFTHALGALLCVGLLVAVQAENTTAIETEVSTTARAFKWQTPYKYRRERPHGHSTHGHKDSSEHQGMRKKTHSDYDVLRLQYDVTSWHEEQPVFYEYVVGCPDSYDSASLMTDDSEHARPIKHDQRHGKVIISVMKKSGSSGRHRRGSAHHHSSEEKGWWIGAIKLESSDCGTKDGEILFRGDDGAAGPKHGAAYDIVGGAGAYEDVSGSIKVSAISKFDREDENDDGLYGQGTITLHIKDDEHSHKGY